MLATKVKTEEESPRQGLFLESSGLQIYSTKEGLRTLTERRHSCWKITLAGGRRLASAAGQALSLGEGTGFHLQQHTHPMQKREGERKLTAVMADTDELHDAFLRTKTQN